MVWSVPAWTNEMFVRTLGGGGGDQSHLTHITTSCLSHRRKQNKSSKKEYILHLLSLSNTCTHRLTQAHTNPLCPLYGGVLQCFSVVTLSSAAFASRGKLRQWHFLSELFDSIDTASVSLEVTLKHPLKKPKLHSLGCCHGLQLFCVGLEGFSESGGAVFYFLKWFGLQWLKHKHTDTHRKASSSRWNINEKRPPANKLLFDISKFELSCQVLLYFSIYSADQQNVSDLLRCVYFVNKSLNVDLHKV